MSFKSLAILLVLSRDLHPVATLKRRQHLGGGKPYLVFTFKTVAVKSVDWSGQSGSDRPEEQVVFEYGSLGIAYTKQLPDGSPVGSPITTGWDMVRNVSAPPPLSPF